MNIAKGEFLGLYYHLKWSEDGLWTIHQDRFKHTYLVSIQTVENEGDTYLGLVFLKLILQVGILCSPIVWLRTLRHKKRIGRQRKTHDKQS